jgi:hypothetical protein
MKGRPISINESIKKLLPVTYEILKEANLNVHPYVYKIVLSGSRGLSNSFRENSDIDLSLLADIKNFDSQMNQEQIFKEILNVTINNWKSRIELDTVVVFDICNCNLDCFNHEYFYDGICKKGGIDCMGLYKIQKGFNGFVPKMGVSIKLIHPVITLWERDIQ